MKYWYFIVSKHRFVEISEPTNDIPRQLLLLLSKLIAIPKRVISRNACSDSYFRKAPSSSMFLKSTIFASDHFALMGKLLDSLSVTTLVFHTVMQGVTNLSSNEFPAKHHCQSPFSTIQVEYLHSLLNLANTARQI